MKYWLMICNPNKWFGEGVSQNAEVNLILRNLETYDWTTGRNDFRMIAAGDKGLLKLGKDHRTIANRTLDSGEIVDKLEGGIYAVVEFEEENGSIFSIDDNGEERVHFRVIDNLYSTDMIVNTEMATVALGNNMKSWNSKEITEIEYYNLINLIE